MFQFNSIIFFSLAIILLLVQNLTFAQKCSYLENEEGNCRWLRDCPAATELLRKAKTDTNSLRNLQIIGRACGYTKATPKVCCLDEVQNTQKFSSGNGANNFGRFTPHSNFRLLPSIEQCSNTPFTDRIIGGKTAPLGSYPWLARIGYLVLSTKRIVYGCAGTIINEKTILTAAHCVENIGSQLRPAEVRLAEHNINTNPDCSSQQKCVYHQDFEISNIKIHPGYQENSKLNDIALIYVKGRISFNEPYVKPVCLPFHEYSFNGLLDNLDHQKTIAAGFGKTKWNKAGGSPLLQHVELSIIPNEACQNEYAISSRITITPTQICAGGEIGKDSCDGDSGGPLMIHYPTTSSPKLIQIGVISYGPKKCGEFGLPGVYTKISEYHDWILDNLE